MQKISWFDLKILSFQYMISYTMQNTQCIDTLEKQKSSYHLRAFLFLSDVTF